MRTLLAIGAALSLFWPTLTHAAGSATLSVSPVSGTYNVGDTVTVSVTITNPSTAASGVTVALNYSSGLQYGSISFNTSVFPVQGTALTQNGNTLTFTYKTSGAGYTGSNGLVATLAFNVLAAGTATVNLDQTNSQVTSASDGSNLLQSVNNGSYTVNTTAAPSASATATTSPTATPSSSLTQTGGSLLPAIICSAGLTALLFLLSRRRV